MSGVVVMDIPSEIIGLGACVSGMAGKSVHLPHKEGHRLRLPSGPEQYCKDKRVVVLS